MPADADATKLEASPSSVETESANASSIFVPAEHYASRDFAEAEKKRLWPQIWQVACREEQVPKVGSQLVYDICEDSILVIRSGESEIRAFYNACPHRGMQLVSGDRRSGSVVCRFHGWRFGLDGRCTHIPYAEDWGGCLSDPETSLVELRCETWGGFVFVHPDPDAPPLRQFLGEAADRLDPYEFDRQRFKWAVSVELNCNWKVALEAFMESYHVQTTHRQLLALRGDSSVSRASGPHGYLISPPDRAGNVGSEHKRREDRDDPRPAVIAYYREMVYAVTAVYTDRDLAAASRIMTELPPTATAAEIALALDRFRREAAEAAGVGWPSLTLEQQRSNGGLWFIFPNVVTLQQPTASIWYRARPFGDGSDPGRCILDFWALERFAPGCEPEVTPRHYADWRTFELPSLLAQDFANLPHMQKGIQSRGFRRTLLNPAREVIIANFHEHLAAMVGA